MQLEIFKEVFRATLHHIAAIHRRRELLEHYAYHDELTGLPNRHLLHDRMQQAVAWARRKAHSFAVLFVDVDRFKLVNDSLGHCAGDELLKVVGARLTHALRAGDTAARLGGDEFVVVLRGTNEMDSIHAAAERIGHALQLPVMIEGREISVSCSVGMSLFPRDGADYATLLKNADLAMYRQKAQHHEEFQRSSRLTSCASNRP